MNMNLYLPLDIKKVMLKITRVTSYLVFFALLLVGSGCKKESNNGVPGMPVVNGFPGCQLTQFGRGMVEYNADGTIKSFGDLEYGYLGNKVVIEVGPREKFTFLLDNRKYPISGSFSDGSDSTLLNYSYNSQGYLSNLTVEERIDGKPGEKFQINYDYINGNKSKMVIYLNGMIYLKSTYTYDLTKLDARKDFFERVFMNMNDPYDLIPFYGGKGNTNMLVSMAIEEDGDSFKVDLTNEYDSNGKITKSSFFEDGVLRGFESYDYICK